MIIRAYSYTGPTGTDPVSPSVLETFGPKHVNEHTDETTNQQAGRRLDLRA